MAARVHKYRQTQLDHSGWLVARNVLDCPTCLAVALCHIGFFDVEAVQGWTDSEGTPISGT